MRVFIVKANPGVDPEVTIRTNNGDAQVIWKGPTPPVLGEANVELDLRGQLRWGMEVEPARSGGPTGIAADGSMVAEVIGVDVDGVLKLSVEGGLLMIAVEGGPGPLRAGDHLYIKGVQIELYPEGV